jgi:CII-binding regulator of phage lambda lysogenization HflD
MICGIGMECIHTHVKIVCPVNGLNDVFCHAQQKHVHIQHGVEKTVHALLLVGFAYHSLWQQTPGDGHFL